MPPPPGPEHQILSAEAGTWDAVVEMAAPDGTTMRSTGIEEDTLACGGRCLVSAFKGEFMPGMTFEGRGVTTWDGAKKKYVGAWTDSMSSGMSVSDGTYDASTKTMTSSMEGPDMTGKVVKTNSTVKYTDARSQNHDDVHDRARRQGSAGAESATRDGSSAGPPTRCRQEVSHAAVGWRV